MNKQILILSEYDSTIYNHIIRDDSAIKVQPVHKFCIGHLQGNYSSPPEFDHHPAWN